MWIEPRSTFIISFPPGFMGKVLVITSGSAFAAKGLAARSIKVNSFTLGFIWLFGLVARGYTRMDGEKFQRNSHMERGTSRAAAAAKALKAQDSQALATLWT